MRSVIRRAATAFRPTIKQFSRHFASKDMGAHTFVERESNESVKFYVNGNIVPKHEAMVNVLDSGFIMGDGVWEGIRLYDGRFAYLDQHLKRLYESAKALHINLHLTPDEMRSELERLVVANNMEDASYVHARLMVTRGIKSTPYQSPKVNLSDPTIVVTIEHKAAAPPDGGLRLATVHVRRGYPDVQDQKLNSHSKLNCITACMQAMEAGADEALMLDPHGFVATCNSTHFFIVKDGEVWTSRGGYCIPGITRGNIIRVCREHGIPVFERDFSVYDVHTADEAFCTGTFAGITPVQEVDGRILGYTFAKLRDDFPAPPSPGPMVARIRDLYMQDILKDTRRE